MRQLFDTEFLESQIFGDSGQEEPEEEAQWIAPQEGEPGEGEMDEEPPTELTLSLADGSSLNCRVSGVFIEQEKEYIALETEDGMIYLMGLSQGDKDELNLRPLEDEEEQEAAMAAFFRMVEEEDYAMQEMYAEDGDYAAQEYAEEEDYAAQEYAEDEDYAAQEMYTEQENREEREIEDDRD